MSSADVAAPGRDSTAEELVSGSDLRGSNVLITGASAGLGLETARVLAARGASLVLPVRDQNKGHRALREVGVPASSYELYPLDLADLSSVRAFADWTLANRSSLQAIIANAGVMAVPEGTTVDGFDTQFGTNHLGHFVLVNRLLPLLVAGAPARVVVVSSAGHRIADVDIEDPGFDRVPYDPWLGYGRSKTANILFAVELDRRVRDLGVRATAIHPGSIETELDRHLTADVLATLGERIAGRPKVVKSLGGGAATSVWAAVVADPADIGGRYCEDCTVALEATDPASPTGYFSYALDPVRARALWDRSEELVGESFPERR